MAHLRLLVSLVGASAVPSLAYNDELNLMQIWKTSDTNVSRQSPTDGGLKSWLITLKSDATPDEVQAFCQEFQSPMYLTQAPFCQGFSSVEGLQQILEKYPGLVASHEEDPYTTKATEHIIPDDIPLERRTYPWGIRDINAHVVRGRGKGVNVYVLDTGIRTTHVAFGGRAFAALDIASKGYMQECAPTDTTCAADGYGHGTHVAGTIGASTYGVADGATIWAIKVLDNSGNGYTMWSVMGEYWVHQSGLRPAVVSISLGGAGTSPAEKMMIDRLADDGVTVVVAAGNLNTDACGWSPANIPSTITVAAYGGILGSSPAMSSFSNYGSCVDVWAPGSYILSTYIGSDIALGESSGTSMACPHVSGLAAIMYEDYPTAGSMTAAQRWSLMTASSRSGYVTGIPSNLPTVNLVALAPTPAGATSATPMPTAPAPAPSVATSPTSGTAGTSGTSGGAAAAVGDPHLQNVHGERFDLMKPGSHVLLNIPRGISADNALLRVEADARRLGGCTDMYFQELNITGSWAEAAKVGGYRYAVLQGFDSSREWLGFGGSVGQEVKIKVVHACTQGGLRYLNFYVKNLGRVGLAVGGLLGEDDHGDVSTPPAACARVMSLLDLAPEAQGQNAAPSSVAAASFGDVDGPSEDNA